MSADLLRESAALIRERAEAATEGPWAWEPTSDNDNGWNLGTVYGGDDTLLSGRIERGQGEVVEQIAERPFADHWHDAEHIASWHPAVALAVADWLEVTAETRDANQLLNHSGEFVAALAVAHAYLGADR